MTPAGRMAEAEVEELGLIEHFLALWAHRWLITLLLLCGLAGGAAYWYFATRIFEGTATLLGPRETGTASALSVLAASGLSEFGGFNIPSSTSSRDMLVSVLKSRTIARDAVEQFGLKERYQVTFVEDAVRRLRDKRSRVEVATEGAITVTVEDPDSKLAAEIANFIVDRADQFLSRIGTGEAGRQRTFVTAQLARAKGDLAKAADALRRFQEGNRAIVLQDQTRAAIEAAARLKGEIVAAEIQLQVVRTVATEAHPDVVSLRQRIDEMKRHLTQVQYGGPSPVPGRSANERPDFLVPFSKVPEVGIELARLLGEVKMQEAVVVVLTQQVEQARIAEVNDLPAVRILDRALPAERPARPTLVFSLAVPMAVSLLLGTFAAFVIEYVGRTRAVRRARAH